MSRHLPPHSVMDIKWVTWQTTWQNWATWRMTWHDQVKPVKVDENAKFEPFLKRRVLHLSHQILVYVGWTFDNSRVLDLTLNPTFFVVPQKIKTVELEGKTIKLHIASGLYDTACHSICCCGESYSWVNMFFFNSKVCCCFALDVIWWLNFDYNAC